MGFINLPLQTVAKRVLLSGKNRKELLESALTRDLTKYFLIEIKLRIKLEMNLILSIYGETGSGKSFFGLRMGEVFDTFSKVPFTVDNVWFSATELLKTLRYGERNALYIMDEQVKMHGQGSIREARDMVNVEETVRRKQYNFIFIAPSLEYHEHHYIIRVWDRDYKKNINRGVLYSSEELPIGYVTAEKPEDELIEKYHEKKDEFLKMLLSGEGGKRAEELLEMAKKVFDTNPPYLGIRYTELDNDKQRMMALKFLYGGRKTTSELEDVHTNTKMLATQRGIELGPKKD